MLICFQRLLSISACAATSREAGIVLTLTAALAPGMAAAALLLFVINPEREALARVQLATSTMPVIRTEPVRNTPRRDTLVKLREAVDAMEGDIQELRRKQDCKMDAMRDDIDQLLLEEDSQNPAAAGLG